MDADVAEIKAVLGRIDERTKRCDEWMRDHEDRNREDFKEVHHRVNAVAGKQNWILGVGSAVGVGFGVLLSWLKDSLS